jgi:hypothetical protein
VDAPLTVNDVEEPSHTDVLDEVVRAGIASTVTAIVLLLVQLFELVPVIV